MHKRVPQNNVVRSAKHRTDALRVSVFLHGLDILRSTGWKGSSLGRKKVEKIQKGKKYS